MSEEINGVDIDILSVLTKKVDNKCDGIRCKIVENNVDLREKIIKLQQELQLKNKVINKMSEWIAHQDLDEEI